MKTIESSSTFIGQNPFNFCCDAVTYMDRNHMQTFSNLTTQLWMQILYNIDGCKYVDRGQQEYFTKGL
jgi:hypothetical protein